MGGFIESGSPVIKTGVSYVQARQIADQTLVLKYGLQGSLAYFRLVRGIGRIKFRPLNYYRYRTGNVMVICARPQETGVIFYVDVSGGQIP